MAFLRERGLDLSEDKTRIIHIDDGFDFLGFNVRKYKGKLQIKPAKPVVKRMLNHIGELIKTNATAKKPDPATQQKVERLGQLLPPCCVEKGFCLR